MKEKRFLVTALLIASIVVMAFFWVEQHRKKILKVGESLPAITYLTRDGKQILSADSARILVLMYFNRKCEYCLYQLELFEKNIGIFRNQKFIFLTSEAEFFSAGLEKQWSRLSNQENCSFGMVPGNVFLNAFGTSSTPAIFIFDDRGVLLANFNNVIKLDKIKQVLGV
jgi:thioredoxin-related protein